MEMDPREVEKQKDRRVKAAAAIILMVAVGLTFCVVYFDSLKRMGTDPAYARAWFEAHQPYGSIVYCLVTVIQILLAVIPGEPLELAAGYAFGAVRGTLLCFLAEGIGSAIVLAAVRKYGKGIVRLFFSDEKWEHLKFLHYSPKRLLLFTVIFMLPGTPKDLLCYFAGLTDIALNKLIILCTICRLPAIVTSTVGGNALGNQSYLFAIGVFAATGVLSVVGIATYNYLVYRHNR